MKEVFVHGAISRAHSGDRITCFIAAQGEITAFENIDCTSLTIVTREGGSGNPASMLVELFVAVLDAADRGVEEIVIVGIEGGDEIRKLCERRGSQLSLFPL